MPNSIYSIHENFPLESYNTFHVKAFSRYFVELSDEEQVNVFLKTRNTDHPVFVLGGGSNVLFTREFPGTIIRPAIRGINLVKEKGTTVFIRAGAGENWDGFVHYCVAQNLAGIENLSWIPGTVGASPVQNIGAYGVEIRDCIEVVEGFYIDSGKKFMFTANDCRFGYRDSTFKNELKGKVIITHVVYRLTRESLFNTTYPDLLKEMDQYSETTVENIRKAIIKIRKFKLPDPDELGNAGSFFKNPVISAEKHNELKLHFPGMPVYAKNDGTNKVPAAWLIEQAGWKGRKYGNTGTHKRQPLIIVNHGGATGAEILECAMKVRSDVMRMFGIKLEMEVNVI